MAMVDIPGEQRLVLSGIDWPAYVAFGDLLGERHVRLTYDRGELEFMTLSLEHERAKKPLARLLEALTEELDIDIAGFGSMTCRREDLERGLEPDECYWIANEPQIRGRHDIDLDRDPPPDLALEVEVSRSALDRLGLYANLGVPEVWRWDGQLLRVCLLQADGRYTESEQSRGLPFSAGRQLGTFSDWGREPGRNQTTPRLPSMDPRASSPWLAACNRRMSRGRPDDADRSKEAAKEEGKTGRQAEGQTPAAGPSQERGLAAAGGRRQSLSGPPLLGERRCLGSGPRLCVPKSRAARPASCLRAVPARSLLPGRQGCHRPSRWPLYLRQPDHP